MFPPYELSAPGRYSEPPVGGLAGWLELELPPAFCHCPSGDLEYTLPSCPAYMSPLLVLATVLLPACVASAHWPDESVAAPCVTPALLVVCAADAHWLPWEAVLTPQLPYPLVPDACDP